MACSAKSKKAMGIAEKNRTKKRVKKGAKK